MKREITNDFGLPVEIETEDGNIWKRSEEKEETVKQAKDEAKAETVKELNRNGVISDDQLEKMKENIPDHVLEMKGLI